MCKRYWLLPLLVVLGVFLGRVWPPQVRAEITESVSVWNTSVSTGTNILTRSLIPTSIAGGPTQTTLTDTTYRVMVGIAGGSSDSIVYLYLTRVSGGGTASLAINNGVALANGNVYNFQFNACADFTYNFHVGTNTTIQVFQVDRIVHGGS